MGHALGNFDGNRSNDTAQWNGVELNYNIVYSILDEAFPIIGPDNFVRGRQR